VKAQSEYLSPSDLQIDLKPQAPWTSPVVWSAPHTGRPMDNAFESWLSSLPKWLQNAAADLVSQARLPDDEGIKWLANLCLGEAQTPTIGFSSVPAGTFDAEPSGAAVRIRSIDGIVGINAIADGSSLDFGTAGMAIIYGLNGAGKSGYARLLKHAAGSRAASGALLPNVYSVASPDQRATIKLERNGSEQSYEWSFAKGPLDSLRHAHIFDTEMARLYMTTKSEASYEPRRLRFISRLVSICDQVKSYLENQKAQIPSSMPAIPQDLASTELAKYITALRPNLTLPTLRAKLALPPDHAEKSKALDDALRTPNPVIRIEAIAHQIRSLALALKTVETMAMSLSEERLATLTCLRRAAVTAREAATQSAAVAFGQASLSGVGAPAWRAMWDAARAYSVQDAYPSCRFPNVEHAARCPLCQQELDANARRRLESFDAFVVGQVEKAARAAEGAHEAAAQGLPALPAEADWLAHFAAIPGAEHAARSAYTLVAARLVAFPRANSTDEVPAADLSVLMALVAGQIAALEKENSVLVKAQESSERPQIEAQLREMRMLTWCNDNIGSIEKELDRVKKLSLLDAALKKTNTTPLTKKKGALVDEELTGGYRERFAAELKALGADRIPVAPIVSSKAKGKIEFALGLVDAKRHAEPAQVLSEGEARVVALAAFLADVTVAGAKTPFIFDDPISSLDHEFEERVVARLIALAKTRQVLVFTHRVSLLSFLRDAGKKDKELADKIEQGDALTMTQITLCRMNGRVGLSTNDKEKPISEAIADIINKRLPSAKGFSDSGKVSEYESAMKAVCSELRILTERAVEDVLLNEVVKRFRRGIQTMGRLHSLSKIELSDCAILDDLMTRLSVFEHAQPEEFPAVAPEVEEIRKHAETLRDWIAGFKKRRIPSETKRGADAFHSEELHQEIGTRVRTGGELLRQDGHSPA